MLPGIERGPPYSDLEYPQGWAALTCVFLLLNHTASALESAYETGPIFWGPKPPFQPIVLEQPTFLILCRDQKLKPTNALAKVVPLVLLKAKSAKVSNANALSEIRRKREIQSRLETSSIMRQRLIIRNGAWQNHWSNTGEVSIVASSTANLNPAALTQGEF